MPHDPRHDIRFAHTVLPAGDGGAESMGPVTRKIRNAESALQERVEFEALVSRISSLFIRLKSDELDSGILEALREIGEFVGVDHCHVWSVRGGGDHVDHTHEWAANGTPHPWAEARGLLLDAFMPWSATRLRRLDGIAIYTVDVLTPEAAVDQATFRRQGIRSVIFVPMAVRGVLAGFIGLDTTGQEMIWTEDAISLLKILAAILGDALERRRAEVALRKENEFTQALLNATGALFIVLDAEGRIVRFNHAAEEVSGLRAEETLGRAPWDIFIPRDERPTARRHFKKLAAGAQVSAYESGLLTRAGGRRVISWSNTALLSADGHTPEYIIMSGIDVTNTKRLEAEVLNVAEREQSRFGHDLHDGLGQHLTGIEFMSQVLQQRLERQGVAEAADLEEITRLIREAIGQTRDLARGLSPVVLQSKGLEVALEDLAASATRHLRAPCRCRFSDPPPLTDNETAIHLYRIAQEAVANSAKHGHATEILISLEGNAGRLELIISDNGRGFPDGFTPGTGMGLRVMQYRAGIIGGTLQVSRTPGSGVGVTVTCTVERPRISAVESVTEIASPLAVH